MTHTADVAIVGGGIVGSACAHYLSRSGLKCLIIERNHVGCGTTAAGMGHVVAMDDSDAQLSLCTYSQSLWRRCISEVETDIEHESCGTLWIAADNDELAAVRRKQSTYAKFGIATQVLDEAQLREAEPELRQGLAGALRVASDSVIYSTNAAVALAKRSSVIQARAKSIANGLVELADGSKVQSAFVINACGIGAVELTPWLPIRLRRGHLAITERMPGFVFHQLVELGYLKAAHGHDTVSTAFNVQPRSTGQALIGSSREFVGLDASINRTLLRQMLDSATKFMPRLSQKQILRIWTGFRPATPDNLPIIGRIDDSIYVAAGHEGLGITTSLATGKLIADQILGVSTTIPLEPFLPSRFKNYSA